ncbi:uncharacterized protein LOC133314238 [Gastrolobium bilobum]|uniref:uncharacterized protein LOC133314238 n=1 Tax=Gastrolobium bilobum TaxID=150636 RepID=UPI002AB3267D|nr:uncharacterized protein LOC133314238 [Gastrolobium bilobum]
MVHGNQSNRERRDGEDEDSAVVKHGVINMISGGLGGGGALGFTVNDLTPVAGEISGFNATTTKPLGMINLRLSLGTPPTTKSADIQFLVLDTQSAYNVILSRRMFAAFKASVSHSHLAMKFVARDNNVATVKGNNQIPLLEEDQSKTAFITQNANYCYTMMPFGLKDAGATYQRMMNEVFKDLIGDSIEVYIDDMIAKSKTPEQHLSHLQGIFDRLRKYNMRLNPSKCAF